MAVISPIPDDALQTFIANTTNEKAKAIAQELVETRRELEEARRRGVELEEEVRAYEIAEGERAME